MGDMMNTGCNLNYFRAREFAEELGGRLIAHKRLDRYVRCFSGHYWARELQISGVPFRKGEDVKDEKTRIILPASELQKAHEMSKNGIYERKGIVLFTDNWEFSDSRGFKVIEDSWITVVEKPVLGSGWENDTGKVDPETKIAVSVTKEELAKLDRMERRQNFFLDGIWPLHRGFSCGRMHYTNAIGGHVEPWKELGVIVESRLL